MTKKGKKGGRKMRGKRGGMIGNVIGALSGMNKVYKGGLPTNPLTMAYSNMVRKGGKRRGGAFLKNLAYSTAMARPYYFG
jgi:hypothetical protein